MVSGGPSHAGKPEREGAEIAGGHGYDVAFGVHLEPARHAVDDEVVDAPPVELAVREDRGLDGEGRRIDDAPAALEEAVDRTVVGATAVA